MSKHQFPAGWDEGRVQRLVEHYENMSDDELIAEDEAAHQAGKNQLPVPTPAPKTNGARRQKKREQPKIPPRGKRRKAKS